jgi:hypothetical protein
MPIKSSYNTQTVHLNYNAKCFSGLHFLKEKIIINLVITIFLTSNARFQVQNPLANNHIIELEAIFPW